MVKVLIIEDDPVMLRMYKPVFELEGFSVVTAADGVSGLAKAKELLPDAIVLDVMMPEMSGIQVLDALKADVATQSIPVIVFTNLSGRDDLDSVLARGAVAALTKAEMTPKQIAQRVREEILRKLG